MSTGLVDKDGKQLSSNDVRERPQTEGKSKIAITLIAATAGILFGGGGVFGVIQWIDTRDVESLKAQYEVLKTQYEVAESQAKLADSYRTQREALQKQLAELKASGGSEQSQKSIDGELRVVNENLTYLLSRQDLPGWAKQRAQAAQSAVTNISRR